MQNILQKLIDSRILTILETININYPDKFAKININKEIVYIKEHILLKQQELYLKKQKKKKKNKLKKIKLKLKESIQINKTETNQESNQETIQVINESIKCSGRVWSNYILNKKTMKQLNNIDEKFKVDDFIDIDIKEFNNKYIIGARCSKNKLEKEKYCKLHSKHLIHGDYLENPNKELCYHFMKDANYL